VGRGQEVGVVEERRNPAEVQDADRRLTEDRCASLG
jgi:hypothetical protein